MIYKWAFIKDQSTVKQNNKRNQNVYPVLENEFRCLLHRTIVIPRVRPEGGALIQATSLQQLLFLESAAPVHCPQIKKLRLTCEVSKANVYHWMSLFKCKLYPNLWKHLTLSAFSPSALKNPEGAGEKDVWGKEFSFDNSASLSLGCDIFLFAKAAVTDQSKAGRDTATSPYRLIALQSHWCIELHWWRDGEIFWVRHWISCTRNLRLLLLYD